MTTERTDTTAADQRKKRQAEELRANLARRKAQARSRREGQADDRQEGIPASKEDKNS